MAASQQFRKYSASEKGTKVGITQLCVFPLCVSCKAAMHINKQHPELELCGIQQVCICIVMEGVLSCFAFLSIARNYKHKHRLDSNQPPQTAGMLSYA